MAELFTNLATSTLASGITNVATTLTVQAGDGAKYPAPTGGDIFRAVLFKKSTGDVEIVTCSARTGDVLTVARAQEGTTGIAFLAGDLVELRPTAAFFNGISAPSWGGITGTLSNQTDLQSALNLKANLASPALTGNPTAPTQTAGNNSTRLATTAFVAALGALKANLASPTFTGTPAAPTAAAATNTTQIATTAFTQSAITAATGFSGLRYRAFSNTNCTTGSLTIIPINSPVITATGGWTFVTDHYVVPSGVSKIIVHAQVTWGSLAANVHNYMMITVGGVAQARATGSTDSTGESYINCSTGVIAVSAAQTIDVRALQSSGGTEAVLAGADKTWCSIETIE